MILRPAIFWLRSLVQELQRWAGSVKAARAQWTSYADRRDGQALILQVPPLPPPQADWKDIIEAGRARLEQGGCFQAIRSVAIIQNADIWAVLKDGTDEGRIGMVYVGGQRNVRLADPLVL